MITEVFTPAFHVHHIDGLPWRNVLSNLEVYRAAVHNKLSARRRGEGRVRRTVLDIMPADLDYILGQGVSVSPRILGIIHNAWRELEREAGMEAAVLTVTRARAGEGAGGAPAARVCGGFR